MIHAVGPLLTIDVGERTTREENIDAVLETFIGGRGVATKLAYDRIPADADPFGPANRLYFTTGPMQVSRMSFTGRTNATALSPLTNGIRSTNAGGYLSRNIADTGYGAIELVGVSDDLIAVHVTDDGVEFEAVPDLESATVKETSAYMADAHELGPEHVATIGPAGENRVRFASVMTFDNRAFGRGGLGAVLGSKHVKCVSFRGDSRPEIESTDGQVRTRTEIHRAAATSESMMRRQGTTSGTEMINDNFSLPTRYFSEYSFEDADAIGGAAVERKKYRKGTCSNCAFACKLPTRDERTGLETEGPEFETVFSFGSNVGIGDLVSIMWANERCDDLGLDTISCGVVIAAYLAANEEFGNERLVHDLIEKIAHRDGEGDLLAEGVDRVHADLGVANWTSKGLEFAAHDGRVVNGQGLSYATSNSGADHMYSKLCLLEYAGVVDPDGLDGKAPALIDAENRAALEDSAIICVISGEHLFEERYEALLGADYEDLLAIGSRIVDLERHFNNRRGFDRSDDVLPYDLPGFEDALEEYYEARGWNADGTVPNERVTDTGTAV